jgi:hypothetical protein
MPRRSNEDFVARRRRGGKALGPPQIDQKMALTLLDAFDRYAATLSKANYAFTQDLAQHMGVRPGALPMDKLIRIRERLDEVDREGGSREMREFRIQQVVDDAVADLLMIPAVRQSRNAAERRSNRPKEPDADLISAEWPVALQEVRQRWPDSKRLKGAVVDNIKARLATNGRRISRRRIARLLPKI